MATVRVLASRLGSDRAPVSRLAYRAQIVDDDEPNSDVVWTCGHEHTSPIEAQSCGLQHLSDLLAGPEELTAAGA